MAGHDPDFDQRVGQILRKRDRLSKGSIKTVTSNGLIVERPRGYRPRMPLRIMLILIFVAVLSKAAFVANVGDAAYTARLAVLAEGGLLDQLVGWLLQIDPLTKAIAGLMASYLG
ncbi:MULTISPECIES: hypothetical protein [unclassified Yoonia]|uniref:hypothetical protein n=1 Tax=unclassified Yoonia TaxID=2629118 RepID=UPI002AFF794C|nr:MULTISPECIES: hypothetical protein [unclassified Yoonia]